LTNTLPNHRSALKYIPEEPWNDSTLPNTSILENVPISVASHYASPDNIVAGGGGLSSVYAAPDWQGGFGVSTARNLPDVSFLAGNGFYGVLWGICTDLEVDPSGNPVADCAAGASGNNFNLTGVGGTSASAPAFAGMLALVKQKTGTRLGQADYVLYHLAKTNYSTVFHDVVTGDNSVECNSGTPDCESVSEVNTYYLSGYNAGSGYDDASGLGSTDAAQMATNWDSASFIPTTSSLELNGSIAALNITHGRSVSVNAIVSSTAGSPAGNVALVDNLSPANRPDVEGISFFSVSGGIASGTIASLPGGTYNVSAHYSGSSTFAESDSNAIPVTVAPESSTTTLKVAGYFDPATGKAATTPYYGYIYLIDAQPYGNSASPATPNGAATGTITFKSGTATLGTATLNSEGVAELQSTTLPGGSNSLTASFPGDASFMASTSAPLAFNVTPAVTTLATPTSMPFDSIVGSPVTLIVRLSVNSGGAAPTGTVTFLNGSTTLGSANLVGTSATSNGPAFGAASLATSSLPSGTDSVTAVYSGDNNYAGSTSPALSVTVLKDVPTLTLSPPSASIKVNQPLQVTITPTPLAGLPLPTGSVTLSLNTNLAPPTNLINGVATVTIPANSLPLGTYSISVEYSGDNDYAGNNANLPITVNSSGTVKPTVTITPPATVTTFPVPITVTVSGPKGDPVATGSITLTSTAYYTYTMPLVNGVVTFVMNSGLAFGPNTLTATYLGDSNYAGGSGTAVVTLPPIPNITFAPFAPTIAVNQPLSSVVTVVAVAGVPTPTGTITLASGSYSSSATQLTAGAATITIPANALSVGSDTLKASYSGDMNYASNSNTETVTVTQAVPPGLTLAGTAVSLSPGATTGNTSTITVTPSGGFTGSVALTAAVTSSPVGAQYPPTLSFGSTSPVSIIGTAAGTATLTITTTAATNSSLAYPKGTGVPWYVAGGATLACLLLFGLPARRRRWRTLLGMLTLLVALIVSVMACGGGGNSGGGGGGGIAGTTAGAYTITVTASSSSTTQTGTITLTVQ